MYPTFFPVQVIESLVVDVVNLPRGWEQRDRQGGLEIKVGGGVTGGGGREGRKQDPSNKRQGKGTTLDGTGTKSTRFGNW